MVTQEHIEIAKEYGDDPIVQTKTGYTYREICEHIYSSGSYLSELTYVANPKAEYIYISPKTPLPEPVWRSVDYSKKFLEQQRKWDKRFLALAEHVAQWSKDPNTKVGAVLVRPDRSIAATGFNGFPSAMPDEDYHDRENKYSRIIHAEMNALHFCNDQSTEGYTLYVSPMPPCDRCSVHIIQAGIKRIVAPTYETNGRWAQSFEKARRYFEECGVEFVQISQEPPATSLGFQDERPEE